MLTRCTRICSPPLSRPILKSLPVLLRPPLSLSLCTSLFPTDAPLCLGWKGSEGGMELLLELLLTMVLSVLIAFLLGKVVSIGASDADDQDARGAEEEAAAPLVPGKESSETGAPASRVGFGGEGVFSGEVVGAGEAIGEIGVGPHAEGREAALAFQVGFVGAGEERRFEEIMRRVEEEVVVEGGVLGAEEAGAVELGVVEADGGEEIPGAAVDEVEENLAAEATEVIGRVVMGLATEEKLLMAEDSGQAVKVALCLDEEKEISKELDSGKTGVESVKDEGTLAVDDADDVKVVPCCMPTEVGLESEDGGPEMSTKSEKVGSLFNEDDDWEGIEKSDLDKLFAAATAFIGGDEGKEALVKLSNDLQMQLYGLYKIATEGPCYESQPMSLKLSARAKWHAWQRLGSMNPEMAMEQYIALVSDNIPEWMPQKNRAGDISIEGESFSPDKGISSSGVVFSSSSLEDQLFQKNERNVESHSHIGECIVPVVSKDSEQGELLNKDSTIGPKMEP